MSATEKSSCANDLFFLFVFCFFGSRGHDFHICLFCPLLCEAVGDEQLLSRSFICSDVLQDCFFSFALPKRREGRGGGVEGGGGGEGWSLASRQRLCEMSICSFTMYFTSDYRLKILVKSFFFSKGKTLHLYFNFPRLLKPVSMNQFEAFFTVCLTLLSLNYTSDGSKRSSSCHFTATNTQQRTEVPPAFPAGKSIIKVPLR